MIDRSGSAGPRALFALVAIGALSLSLTTGCAGAAKPALATANATTPGTCAALAPEVVHFTGVLEDGGESTGVKGRRESAAGILEMLIGFDRASAELQAQIATRRAGLPAAAPALHRAAAAMQLAGEYSKAQRERIEAAALAMEPLIKEKSDAYAELRGTCDVPPPRRGAKTTVVARECAAVNDTLRKVGDGPFTEQVIGAEELAAMRITTAAARPRDRAVAATRALAKALEAQASERALLTRKWATFQRSIGEALQTLPSDCRTAAPGAGATFLADAKPDPRKLTVLVRVKPPAGIDDTFKELAERAKDDAVRAFYQARAKGAFGSGFVVVRQTPAGSEALVITNRHVVELSDSASLELADGTSLGAAEIIYTDPVHDVAVLRPARKLPFDKGFAFAPSAPKDQQGVVATGFPGMAGRPSYQTTRGYVSNESFRLDESARPLVYVQHTAPIDPGSSGGPLTDERGYVLGVNTLKVTNREAVALAVPASSILETLRSSDLAESTRTSAPFRRESARLACLGIVAELAAKKPRMLLLESMISNNLTSSEGLDAAMAIEDEEFGKMWQHDSVRAMRIATLVRLSSVLGAAGGANALETCNDAHPDDVRDILTADEVRYHLWLGNWDAREVAFKWEQGHWKLARMDLRSGKPPVSVAAKLAQPVTRPAAATKPAAPKKKK